MHILHTYVCVSKIPVDYMNCVSKIFVDYMNCAGLAQPFPNYNYVMVRTCKENLKLHSTETGVNAVKKKKKKNTYDNPTNMTPKT